jgi:pyruvate dehydrogenase E1 component
MAALVPNCRAYDPAFAGELAVIIDHGARQMLEKQEDVFYYITVTNENYPQPTLSACACEHVIKGMYRLKEFVVERAEAKVHLLGSGAILRQVIEAGRLLREEWQIGSDIWSVTSFGELAREAREVERFNRLHPTSARRKSHLAACLDGGAPVVATTDYVCAYPHMVSPYLSNRVLALGTDGFGRSDTRAKLRRFFEVDSRQIVATALYALALEGHVSTSTVEAAIGRYEIEPGTMPPWLC